MTLVCRDFRTEFTPYRDAGIGWGWNATATQLQTTGVGGSSHEQWQMSEWITARGLTGTREYLMRFTVQTADMLPGIGLAVRLPTPPFNPQVGGSCAAPQQFCGAFFSVATPGASTLFVLNDHIVFGAHGNYGVQFPWIIAPGNTFSLRFRIDVAPDGSYGLSARAWRDDEAEPASWHVTHLAVTPADTCFVPDGGRVAVVATPGQMQYTFTHIEERYANSASRVRSHASEDAGSIFQTTTAIPVESQVSEAYPYAASVGPVVAFEEALTPGVAALRYYSVPTRNQEMLVTVDGATNLGRLAGTYPAAVMLPASSIPGAVEGRVTAQRAIQHVTTQWASAHPWLSFAPIPDLRLMVPSAVAAPRQHYVDNPGDGVLTTAAVVIPQEGNERRSMREILDEWLAIFPGTIVRQTSAGAIELVPRVGPDAPSGAAVTLTWSDLTGISDGEDDPSGVTNRCRVTSQGWEFTPNQALIAPSFVLVRAANGVTRAVLDGENVLPTGSREEHSIYDDLVFTGLTAPTAATVDVVIHAYGSWSPTTSSSFSLEGTATRQVTLAAGQAQDVSITHNSRSQNVTASFRLRRSADGGRITVSAPGGVPESAGNPFGRTWFAYVLDVDVTGTAWVRSNERVESEFGQTGTALPGAGGGDALADSRALYGERLAVINSNVFQLTNEQAQLVARSYVLANINPRTIRDVQQSEWDKYPVKFDHIGRLVDLPTGERAVIENRSYSDSFSSTSGTMQSTFSASVTEIVIDTTTDWLLLDSGDFMQLDSGTLLEVS